MSIASEFKEFAMKGNVIDLAVGVIIGAAFGKIVSSLVGDIFMPPLGEIIGGVNFSDLAVDLGKDPSGKEVLLKYWRLSTDDSRLPDHCIRLVHRHPRHQPPEEAPPRRA